MTAFVYIVVMCITTGAQQTCLPAGNPFVGPDAERLCYASAERANRTAPPRMEYFCGRREAWSR